jgi:hypothetical protein
MGTLVCRVELSKTEGLILTVENKEGKITQTAVLDGQSITITSEGEQDTSTITQKPDSIEIKCKEFTLDATTITCKSKEDTLHQSQQKFKIESTQDMTLNSKGKVTADAMGDVSVSSKANVDVSATMNAEISGTAGAKLNSTASTEVKGLTLTLKGDAKAEMKAPMVDVSADGILNVKGALTNVEGQMASVKGTLTKVG